MASSEGNTDEPVLLTEQRDHTLVLTMNRPRRHHALNRALSTAIGAALAAANDDADIRVVVLTGSGDKAFCAGADMLEASGVEETPPPGLSAMGAIDAVDTTPVPVIAAINGYCYGGGARLAIGCDILLASDTATFRLPGAEYGLVVGAATLPRLIGASKAKELIFTARKFDAADALGWGMLSHVYPQADLMPAAIAIADEIAANSVSAVRESKRVIDAATLSDAASAMENDANKVLRGSDEQSARFRTATRKVTGRQDDEPSDHCVGSWPGVATGIRHHTHITRPSP